MIFSIDGLGGEVRNERPIHDTDVQSEPRK